MTGHRDQPGLSTRKRREACVSCTVLYPGHHHIARLPLPSSPSGSNRGIQHTSTQADLGMPSTKRLFFQLRFWSHGPEVLDLPPVGNGKASAEV
jgi:hypothetical protein